MNEIDIINKAKINFDKAFFSKGYDNIISDSEHLNKILDSISLNENEKCLDMGCGSGYVTFPLATRFKDSSIVGIDILRNTIERDNKICRDKHINNLSFIEYDGLSLPFDSNEFDLITSRYAFHHFPNADRTVGDFSRILKEEGRVFISDPTPNLFDKDLFIDEYMNLRDDGHVHLYALEEYIELFKKYGFILEDIFMSKVRFPRKLDDSYIKLIKRSDPFVVHSYDVDILGEEIFVSLRVLNMTFSKERNSEYDEY
ncbi:MAG: methyltransferase domain-containing protein [Clostridium sp.]